VSLAEAEGQRSVQTTMIYTHALNRSGRGVQSRSTGCRPAQGLSDGFLSHKPAFPKVAIAANFFSLSSLPLTPGPLSRSLIAAVASYKIEEPRSTSRGDLCRISTGPKLHPLTCLYDTPNGIEREYGSVVTYA